MECYTPWDTEVAYTQHPTAEAAGKQDVPQRGPDRYGKGEEVSSSKSLYCAIYMRIVISRKTQKRYESANGRTCLKASDRILGEQICKEGERIRVERRVCHCDVQ